MLNGSKNIDSIEYLYNTNDKMTGLFVKITN